MNNFLHNIIIESINELLKEDYEQQQIDSEQNQKIKGVIFDFDYTLVDGTATMEARSLAKHKQISWDEALTTVPKIKPYNGINELLSFLEKNGIQYCIVSDCKQAIVESASKYFGWNPTRICGKNLYRQKSHLMNMCLQKMGITNKECLSIGDMPSDEEHSLKCGIQFIGCTWGNGAPSQYKKATVSGVSHPNEIINYIQQINGAR